MRRDVFEGFADFTVDHISAPRVSSLLKGSLWRRCFPVGSAELFGVPFLWSTLGVTASVTKNTSATNKQHNITGNIVDLTKPMFNLICITMPTRF